MLLIYYRTNGEICCAYYNYMADMYPHNGTKKAGDYAKKAENM